MYNYRSKARALSVTVSLPYTRCCIQTGRNPIADPATVLTTRGASLAAGKVPVIALQSAGFHIWSI